MTEDQLRRAVELAKAGQKVQARYLLNDILEKDPVNIKGWKWLAAVAGSEQQAREAIERVLTLDPDDAWAVNLLAELDAGPSQRTLPVQATRRKPPTSPLQIARPEIRHWLAIGFAVLAFGLSAAIGAAQATARAKAVAARPTSTPAPSPTVVVVETTPTIVTADSAAPALPPSWTPSATFIPMPTPIPTATRTAAPLPVVSSPTPVPFPTAVKTATPTVPTPVPTNTEVPASGWPAQRVLIISVDGLRPDAISAAPAPTILALAARGSYSWTAQTVAPSSTLPAHASMLSGVPVSQHGITWNSYIPANGSITVPTVFSEAHAVDGHTVMVVGLERLLHAAAPGTVDVVINMEGAGDYAVSSRAASAMLAPGFDVLFVHLKDVDFVGHNSGWMSSEYLATVRAADSAIAQLLNTLDAAGWTDTTTVIITADHGGEGFFHTNDTPQNRTVPWVIAGPGVISDHEIPIPVSVMDTAPTALYAIDVPVPGSFVGRPIYEAFR